MLILGLVNDSEKRLTISEIKIHPFFDGFDWHNVHKMKSPFVPKVKDDVDVSNFDVFDLKTPWTENERAIICKFNKKTIR
jgi:hypothetical protein